MPFSDIGWALTNLYWEQHLWGNRVALVGGVVDSTDYVDVYGLVNPWADFSNLAFSTDPTIPAPNPDEDLISVWTLRGRLSF